MQAAIDRIMRTYDLLMNCTSAASDEARAKVTDYVTKLVEAYVPAKASAKPVLGSDAVLPM